MDGQARPEEYDRAGWRLLSSDGRGAILFVLLCATPIRSVSYILVIPIYIYIRIAVQYSNLIKRTSYG